MNKYIFCLQVLLLLCSTDFIFRVTGQEVTPEIEAQNPMVDLITTWFEENDDCLLPCLWGFRIGKATEGEWLRFILSDELEESSSRNLALEPKREKRSGIVGIYTGKTDEEENKGFNVLFSLSNSKLRTLTISTSKPYESLLIIEQFSLIKILETYDIENLYFSVRTRADENRIIIRQDGWEITYNYDYEDIYEDTIKPLLNNRQYIYCLQPEYITAINIEINSEIEAMPDRRLRSDAYYTPERGGLTGYMPNDEFINFFIENPDECLITDIGEPQNDTD